MKTEIKLDTKSFFLLTCLLFFFSVYNRFSIDAKMSTDLEKKKKILFQKRSLNFFFGKVISSKNKATQTIKITE